MRKSVVAVLLAAALAVPVAASVMAAPGHGPGGHDDETAYGKPGDPKRPARTIPVTMREMDGKMLFIPDRIEVRRGEQIRFALRNAGALDHEFVLATKAENMKHMAEMEKNPDMEHDDPNARRLKSGTSGEIIWQFTKAGTFDISCLIPGHRRVGMHGIVVVK